MSAALVALSSLVGCGSADDEGTDPEVTCNDAEIVENGECILDPFRFEPDTQLDEDNVLYFSGKELTILTDLPDPPKSGFRLIMEPQDIPPGFDSDAGEMKGIEDFSPCQSWPMPEVKNRWVYTAQIHTTPGLHHANMYGLEVDPVDGAQPYPQCRMSADSLVFGQISRALGGADRSELFVPTVLFANSTQVIGVEAERYALADGYAYELPPGIEIATNTHLQNTTPDMLHVEAAWDFYTMPADLVTDPAIMFVYIHFGFLLPPRSDKAIHGNCDWGGGDVLAIMPHTHQWATGFQADFGMAPEREFDGAPMPARDVFATDVAGYSRQGTGLADSDIETYYPALKTAGTNAVQFECQFRNTTDHDMVFGVGENEMCFMFGYTSPPEGQRVGLMLDEQASCLTVNDGSPGQGPLDFGGWLASQPPDVAERIAAFRGGGG